MTVLWIVAALAAGVLIGRKLRPAPPVQSPEKHPKAILEQSSDEYRNFLRYDGTVQR